MLPPPFEWLVSHGPMWTLFICLMISPGIPQILGVIFCSYWPSLDPRDYQFWAYSPGDLFLALFVAGTTTFFQHGRVAVPWYIQAIVAVVMLGVWWKLTSDDKKVYTKAQMRSANKVYHNLLYFWYGSLAIICFIGMWWYAGGSVYEKFMVMAFGLVWVACLIKDGRDAAKGLLAAKYQFAHADNFPIWKTRGRLRRRTKTGYALAA